VRRPASVSSRSRRLLSSSRIRDVGVDPVVLAGGDHRLKGVAVVDGDERGADGIDGHEFLLLL
jgi:hypothetical protein